LFVLMWSVACSKPETRRWTSQFWWSRRSDWWCCRHDWSYDR